MSTNDDDLMMTGPEESKLTEVIKKEVPSEFERIAAINRKRKEKLARDRAANNKSVLQKYKLGTNKPS